MTIYFTASVRGKKEFAANYRKIVDVLEKTGYKIFSDHILENDPSKIENQNRDQSNKAYSKLISRIKKSDVFIAEVSTQSLSVGHEITEAINMNLPVVLLYTGKTKPTLLFGSKYSKLQIVEYDNKNIETILPEVVEIAKKYSDVRFNFFVSPKILSYLDWVSKKRMVPRSVFLRDLIEKEMKKDKEFKG